MIYLYKCIYKPLVTVTFSWWIFTAHFTVDFLVFQLSQVTRPATS